MPHLTHLRSLVFTSAQEKRAKVKIRAGVPPSQRNVLFMSRVSIVSSLAASQNRTEKTG